MELKIKQVGPFPPLFYSSVLQYNQTNTVKVYVFPIVQLVRNMSTILQNTSHYVKQKIENKHLTFFFTSISFFPEINRFYDSSGNSLLDFGLSFTI